MKAKIFKGAATALVTPMKPDGSISYDTLSGLIDYQLKHHADAVVIGGTTGESASLSEKELLELTAFTVKAVRGHIPVIANMGSNNTAHSAELAGKMEKLGADALLSVTPYYNKASQQGLYEHFKAGAAATGLPIILYNVPSRTGVNIAVDTYKRLSEIDNIAAVKEASGNFSQMAQIAAECGDALDIYSGNDDQIVPALALGAAGVISVLSNLIPEQVHQICASYFEGNVGKSRYFQLYYLELAEALFSDINPIPVKQALNDMGLDVGSCRLPLCDMAPAEAGRLLKCMHKYGLCRFSERSKEKRFHVKRRLSLISGVF